MRAVFIKMIINYTYKSLNTTFVSFEQSKEPIDYTMVYVYLFHCLSSPHVGIYD